MAEMITTMVERWLADPWPLRGAEPDEGDQSPEDQQDPDDHAPEAGEQQQDQATSHEAAQQRYRRRAAEAARDAAVAERDALAQRLAHAQRAEAERIAGDVLVDGSDLFTIGNVELSDLLTPEGWVDHAAVVTAADAIVAARGFRFARTRTNYAGSPDGGARESPPRQRSLGEALQGLYVAQRNGG